ncbi:MAG TPA: DUF4258 domain-containing protein [Chloroflexota bacterium]|nr:DUF4258 domain-containing protein [Chloroflexota bacterium]
MVGDELQKLAHIRQAFASRNYRFTMHAEQQRIARGILGSEIEEVAMAAELVEDYPQHHYGPCCLVLGLTPAGNAPPVVRCVSQVVGQFESSFASALSICRYQMPLSIATASHPRPTRCAARSRSSDSA